MKPDYKWYHKQYYVGVFGPYYDVSGAWVRANELKDYLKNVKRATRLVSKWRKDGKYNSYAYVDKSSNLKGKGNEVIFYDWEDDGDINHSALCVGTGVSWDSYQLYGQLINQHSRDRQG